MVTWLIIEFASHHKSQFHKFIRYYEDTHQIKYNDRSDPQMVAED